MIKLKDLLLENDAPNIFIPRRLDDRPVRYNQMTQKEVNRIVDDYNNRKNKDSLDLSGSDPEEYDDDDDIQTTELELKYTKVKQLPLFKNFIKNIDLEGCKSLKTLPQGFTAGELTIEYSPIVSIPNNVKLKQLVVRECKNFTSIGSNCSIDILSIGYGCLNFTTLPTDIKANQVSIVFNSQFRINLLNQYKTDKKILNALQKMYPNVQQFMID